MNRLGIVLMVGIAALGCKKRVKSEEIEAWIKQRTDELGTSASKVTCPKDIELKVGVTFDCNVEIEGKTYVLVATVTSLEGGKVAFNTGWKGAAAGVVIRSKLVPPLTAELTKVLATPVTIACAEPLLFLDATSAVTCDVSAGTAKAKVIVTVDANIMPTGWRLDPGLLNKVGLEQMLTPSVREKTSPTVTVTCGSEPLLTRPASGVVVCDLADGAKKARVNVEIDADLKVGKWEVVP